MGNTTIHLERACTATLSLIEKPTGRYFPCYETLVDVFGGFPKWGKLWLKLANTVDFVPKTVKLF